MQSLKMLFEHPFTCIVSGPTKSGKTSFIQQIIQNRERLINTKISKIWWCYTENQPLYQKVKNVTFVEGFPDFNRIKQYSPTPQLVVLDDLMQESKGKPQLIQLFTRGCHHWNVSLIHVVHNLFFDGLRTSRVNSDYIVLLKNPSDKLQAQVLARQLYPSNSKYFLEAFIDATSQPHGYLLIDLTQNANDLYRLKTDIFSTHPTVYIPKSINNNNARDN